MTTVEIPSALTAEYQINVPEVNAAIEMYRREDASRGNPVVIPATGSDHNGLLYALLPASKQTIQAMRLDSKANGSVWLSFQRPPRNAGAPRVPCNLTVRPSEVGMTYPDGDVAWYAV